MQYDKDTTSEFGDMFHQIRRILLSYPQIKEMIEESFILGIETAEMKKLRKKMR